MTKKFERILHLAFEVLEAPPGSPEGNFYVSVKDKCDDIAVGIDAVIDTARSIINRGDVAHSAGVIVGACMHINTAIAPVGTYDQLFPPVINSHHTLQ